MEKRLYRDPKRGMIGGVCAGVADYFDIDVSIVRVVWFILLFAASFGLLVYIACWIAMPEKSQVANVMREEDVAVQMRHAKDAGYDD